MVLQIIFQSAAVMAVHTGVATGLAAAMGSDNPASVGLASFAVGIPSLIAGAFAGHAITYKPETNYRALYKEDDLGATVGGLMGYTAGSFIGFALKHS